MKVSLTQRQKKTIRRVIEIQLAALQAILNGETEEDITLYCINEEINKVELFNLIQRNIHDCTQVLKDPETFLILPQDQLEMVKHILNHIQVKPRIRRQVWRKMMVYEELHFNPN